MIRIVVFWGWYTYAILMVRKPPKTVWVICSGPYRILLGKRVQASGGQGSESLGFWTSLGSGLLKPNSCQDIGPKWSQQAETSLGLKV